MRDFTRRKGAFPVPINNNHPPSPNNQRGAAFQQQQQQRATLNTKPANFIKKTKLTPFSPPLFTDKDTTLTLPSQPTIKKPSLPTTSSPVSALELLLFTFLLAALLSLIIYLAVQIASMAYQTLTTYRRRYRPPTPSPFDSRHNHCLWTGAFPDHVGSHAVYQLRPGAADSVSGSSSESETGLEGVVSEAALTMVNGARKKSSAAWGRLHGDFVELRRRFSKVNGEEDPMTADVEVGITAGMEGVDVEGLFCVRRRVSSFGRR
ncbi:hypothetical protein QBC34DRAFT_476155 [Podospora aff. communis PSN243]|uniref:Uncharacterized protein n=1 Tax=Podospora aff. communis PSN243 TaxID=3040156 RepID=A0AAV9G976_9PEZI|nr:hypothetical protein QBC34DRAFT_476155 [Podospora aff. communis PSN243]